MNIVIHSLFTDRELDALSTYLVKHSGQKTVKNLKTIDIIFGCIAGFAALIAITAGDFGSVFLLILAIVLMLIVTWYTFNKSIPASLKKENANIRGSDMTIAFYDDYLFEKLETPLCICEESIRYEGLLSVAETAEHFFIHITEAKLIVLPKRDIPMDCLPELTRFLSYKFGPHYKRF